MDMSINQRLEKFLREKNISQEQLKVKLGLKTRQQVSNWINGHDPIPAKHLIAIIQLFPDLNANWLLRDVGSPFIDQQTLRQIHRNEYGFCEGCQDKDIKIKLLNELMEKQDKRLRDICIEYGKSQEKVNQLEKKAAGKNIKKK